MVEIKYIRELRKEKEEKIDKLLEELEDKIELKVKKIDVTHIPHYTNEKVDGSYLDKECPKISLVLERI